MKQLLTTLLLLSSQFVFSQYRTNSFILSDPESAIPIHIGYNITQDTTISINVSNKIYGLYVSGTACLNGDDNSYFRITMKESYNMEYLVYELYPLLADSLTMNFQRTALETKLLNGIIPQNIKIEIRNASIQLDSIYYLANSNKNSRSEKTIDEIQKDQCEYIAAKLNSNLLKKNIPWRAGVTSMSRKTYDEKKDMFGGVVPYLGGFEYYKEGIFIMPNFKNNYINDEFFRSGSPYVKEWDWRNRHGKNWMTSVKNQGNCNTCWAFASLGLIETYINLYYNQLINYDLSEQELISCTNNSCRIGSNFGVAFSYVKNNGIVLEDCFPYNTSDPDCSFKCGEPVEKIYIEYYNGHSHPNENQIKQQLLHRPIILGLNLFIKHAVVLAGYKKIQNGDVIYLNTTYTQPTFVTIDSITHSNLVGNTAWLIKNSWGNSWGNNGYGYVVTNLDSTSIFHIDGNITSMQYDSTDIICEDSDGDGYYFWGIGPKPLSCPSWIPDEPDGDDSDTMAGPMDEYGYLEDLNPLHRPIIEITTSEATTEIGRHYNYIRISNNATWTINHNQYFYNGAEIIVKNGSTLVVSGATLENVNISIESGAKIIVNNNGRIHLKSLSEFAPPLGAIIEMNYGEIK